MLTMLDPAPERRSTRRVRLVTAIPPSRRCPSASRRWCVASTLVDNVTTCVARAPALTFGHRSRYRRQSGASELAERLKAAGMKVVSTIGNTRERAPTATGQPRPIEFTDRVIAVVRYRDGSVIDVVHQVKE